MCMGIFEIPSISKIARSTKTQSTVESKYAIVRILKIYTVKKKLYQKKDNGAMITR